MPRPLPITRDTLVSDILREYGDIADVMEAFGVTRASGLTIRKALGRFLTVQRAAKFHGVPVDEFVQIVRKATGQPPEEEWPVAPVEEP